MIKSTPVTVVREELEVLLMRLEDGRDRNVLPADHSPYKTRLALADRNADHYVSCALQLAAIIRGESRT